MNEREYLISIRVRELNGDTREATPAEQRMVCRALGGTGSFPAIVVLSALLCGAILMCGYVIYVVSNAPLVPPPTVVAPDGGPRA